MTFRLLSDCDEWWAEAMLGVYSGLYPTVGAAVSCTHTGSGIGKLVVERCLLCSLSLLTHAERAPT